MRVKPLVVIFFVFLTGMMQGQFQNRALDFGITHTYDFGGCGAGLSTIDFNGDGLDDITLPNGGYPGLDFYIQTETGFQFIEITSIELFAAIRSVIWVDYDNDGDKDLYVTSNNPFGNCGATVGLFEQIGDLIFQEVTCSVGLGNVSGLVYGSSWHDIDKDGHLDLSIPVYDLDSNYFFMSNGLGQFIDKTVEFGLEDVQGMSFMTSFLDADGDGEIEMFTANDRVGSLNKFYSYDSELGTFVDKSESSGLLVQMHSMGVETADFDGDEDPDIYVTNTNSQAIVPYVGNVYFQNDGVQEFSANINWPDEVNYGFFWGCNAIDFDADRDLDLFTVAGSRPTTRPGVKLFENKNDTTFVEYVQAEFNAGFNINYGSAQGDLNNDGFPDIFVLSSFLGLSQCWVNTPSSSNYVKLKLEGVVSNTDAIGSYIEVWSQGDKRVDMLSCGNSYLSQDSETMFFGLGTAQVDSVVVSWPNGHVNRFLGVQMNSQNHLIEDVSQYEVDLSENVCSVFEASPLGLTKSFNPVNGVRDRLQVKWYKELPKVKYSDEDAAACDIKFWEKRDLDPLTGNATGPTITNPDTLLIPNAKKFHPDGSPRSIFKWPIFFYKEGANNSRRALPNKRYQWQVRCACEHGLGPESPWSEVKFFNTPDFDTLTGIYSSSGMVESESDLGQKTLGETNEKELLIYPNPNDGSEIWLSRDRGFTGLNECHIYDISGKLILVAQVMLDKGVQQLGIDLKAISEGHYILRLQSAQEVSEAHFIVTH